MEISGNLGGWVIVALFAVSWFSTGYAVGRRRRIRARPPDQSEEPVPILLKRTRPSFRHPGKVTTTYDEYKTSKGLYSPIRPGKGSTADEKEIK